MILIILNDLVDRPIMNRWFSDQMKPTLQWGVLLGDPHHEFLSCRLAPEVRPISCSPLGWSPCDTKRFCEIACTQHDSRKYCKPGNLCANPTHTQISITSSFLKISERNFVFFGRIGCCSRHGNFKSIGNLVALSLQ